MIGPDLAWEFAVQDNGRLEMTRRLLHQGPAAAAEFATLFEASANRWLEFQGFRPDFRFEWIELPTVS